MGNPAAFFGAIHAALMGPFTHQVDLVDLLLLFALLLLIAGQWHLVLERVEM